MGNRFQRKVAVVTGSTRGIGEGIARALAAEGAAVIVSGLEIDLGEVVTRTITQAGGQAAFVRADLTRPEDCQHLIQSALDHFGRLDILVNNAAIVPSLSLEDTTPEKWDEIFALNARGAFLCCRAAIPIMQRQGGGSIINIGSTVIHRAQVDRIAYACSKAALLTMTKTLARSYLADKIRANWITVGWVATPGEIELRDALSGDGAAFLQNLSNKAPLGRLETSEDIATGVLYLASDDASHVTGCELNISGGLWI